MFFSRKKKTEDIFSIRRGTKKVVYDFIYVEPVAIFVAVCHTPYSKMATIMVFCCFPSNYPLLPRS